MTIVEQLEQQFFQAAYKLRSIAMTPEQTSLFFRLTLITEEAFASTYEAAIKTYEGAVAHRNATRFKKPIDKRVLLFLTTLCESPGDLVMYLSYAVWQVREQGYDALTWENFSFIFPLGFWSPEDRAMLWNAQKDPSRAFGTDNALDAAPVLSWLNRETNQEKEHDAQTARTDWNPRQGAGG